MMHFSTSDENFRKASVRLQSKSSLTQNRWNFLNPSTHLDLIEKKTTNNDLLQFS